MDIEPIHVAAYIERHSGAAPTAKQHLAAIRTRVAVLHGQFSAIVTPDVTDYMNELLGRNAPFVEIPQSHHHLMLDQPLAFVAAVRALLADWEHSLPARKGP